MSMKFKSGAGSALLMANPMPAESKSMPNMTASAPSPVLVRRSILPVAKPVTAPMTTGRNTSSISTSTGMFAVERCAATKATTRKKTSAPTRSSSAAMGMRVRVTGPSAFSELTTESDGAGAVARAMPPNRKAM